MQLLQWPFRAYPKSRVSDGESISIELLCTVFSEVPILGEVCPLFSSEKLEVRNHESWVRD
jgi:hypothetical protein